MLLQRRVLARLARSLASEARAAHAAWHVGDELQRGLARLGVVAPTSVQANALPLAMSGLDVLAISQTGSGKTLMFLLPLLQRLCDGSGGGGGGAAAALVLAPTAALACQHAAVAGQLASTLPLAVECATGAAEAPSAAPDGGARLLVTTPEAVLGGLPLPPRLRGVAIDEADAILCGGEFDDTLSAQGEALLRAVEAGRAGTASPPPQYLLTTAWLSTAHEAALRRRFPGASRVAQASDARSGPVGALVPTLRQVFHYFRGDRQAKLLALLRRERAAPAWHDGTTLVFCAGAARATALHAALLRAEGGGGEEEGEAEAAAGTGAGAGALLLHERLGAGARARAVAEFGAAGGGRLLVCSSAVARGLDLPAVTHVLLFDMPADTAAYVHCVGRTARRGRSGRVSCLVQSNAEAGRYRHLHALQPAARLSFQGST